MMASRSKLAKLLLAFAAAITVVFSTSCLDFTSQSSCFASATCYWEDYDTGDTSDDACVCNTTIPQAIAFVMDSSGSVQAEGWTNATKFVASIIRTGTSADSIIGVIQFASDTNVNTRYRFTESQVKETIATTVEGLPFTGGWTATRIGINEGVDLWTDNTGNNDIWGIKSRVMMIVTDGVPVPTNSQNPCLTSGGTNSQRTRAQATRDSLTDNNITVIIIGVGNSWDPDILSCLVDDPDSQIIRASSYNTATLNAIRSATDAFLCPATIEIVLSELRLNDSAATSSSGGDQRFIELYNRGDAWDFSGQMLILEGFLTCNITSVSELTWYSKDYLVIYDSTRALPECEGCACTYDTVNTEWCDSDTALYLDGADYGCVWDESMGNQYWQQSAIDLTNKQAGNSPYFNVTYDAITGSGFADGTEVYVYQGYTFVLKRTYRSMDKGTNWQMSCTEWGTPGAGPVYNCTSTCIESLCDLDGDAGAVCNSKGTQCVCTVSEHFYPDGSRCRYLEPPSDCHVYVSKNSSTLWIEEMLWSPSPVEYDHFYNVLYYTGAANDEGSVSVENPLFSYYDTKADPYPLPTLRTELPWLRGRTYYSEFINCTLHSGAPTVSPTMSPTYTYPANPCTVTVVGGTKKSFDVSWEQVDLSAAETPNNSSFYRVWLVANGASSFVDVDRVNGDSANTYTRRVTTGQSITTPTTQVQAYVIYEIRLDNVRSSSEMVTYRTQCDMITVSPTKSPTKNPTKSPTPKPTSSPVPPPTEYPTIENWVITDCTATVQAKSYQSVRVRWTLTSGSSSVDPKVWLDLPATNQTKYTQLGTSTTDGSAGKLVSISNAASQTFFVWPEYEAYPGGPNKDKNLVGVVCDIITSNPTVSPTKAPTKSPTKFPTKSPTVSPTKNPTKAPTQSPTYSPIPFNCSYTLDAYLAEDVTSNVSISRGFTLYFTEPQYRDGNFSDDYNLPLSSEVFYRMEWTSMSLAEEFDSVSSNFDIETPFSFDITWDDILTLQILTDMGSGERENGAPVECTPRSLAPTMAPFTDATPAPTFQPPVIFFVPLDTVCEIYETTIEGSSRLEYPRCEVPEQDEPYNVPVRGRPSAFGWDIYFNWEVHFRDPLFDRHPFDYDDENNQGDAPDEAYTDYNDFDIISGDGMIQGSYHENGAEDGVVTITVLNENRRRLSEAVAARREIRRRMQDEGDAPADAATEFAYLVLVNCTVDDGFSETEYNCSVADGTNKDEPSILLVVIEDKGRDNIVSGGTGDVPSWIAWPIVAAGLLLIAAAIFGYRVYNKRKFAAAELADREAELAVLHTEEGLDIDDAMTANPMSTGGVMEFDTVGDIHTRHLQTQMDENELATVPAETIKFTSQMGQVHATRDAGF
jgi:hypothetical protein